MKTEMIRYRFVALAVALMGPLCMQNASAEFRAWVSPKQCKVLVSAVAGSDVRNGFDLQNGPWCNRYVYATDFANGSHATALAKTSPPWNIYWYLAVAGNAAAGEKRPLPLLRPHDPDTDGAGTGQVSAVRDASGQLVISGTSSINANGATELAVLDLSEASVSRVQSAVNLLGGVREAVEQGVIDSRRVLFDAREDELDGEFGFAVPGSEGLADEDIAIVFTGQAEGSRVIPDEGFIIGDGELDDRPFEILPLDTNALRLRD